MQYSIVTILKHPVILDSKEGVFINTFVKEKTMPAIEEFEEDGRVNLFVYGAVLHNEGCEKINHKELLGKTFIYPKTESYGTLTFVDMYLLPILSNSRLSFTPFSAHIRITPELTSDKDCISAFLRYDEMDIITNILNRECIYAIKETKVLQNEEECKNWRRYSNEDRMLEIAFSIK